MRKIFVQICVFAFLFLLVFSFMRGVMAYHFAVNEVYEELAKMFFVGLRMDLKTLGYIFLPFLLSMLVSALFKRLNGGGYSLVIKIYTFASSFYLAIVSFLCLVFAFINFYYYQMYKNKIDIFIFGLKDDDTAAIFSIIFKDYPILTLIFLALIFSIFCVFLNLRILKANIKKLSLKTRTIFILNLCFILLYFGALRGNNLRYDYYQFSPSKVINELSTNPMLAFYWAFKNYSKDIDLKPMSKEEGVTLQAELFPLFQKSAKNDLAKKLKPHIYFNLMESFGLNVLEFSNKNYNFLGHLDKHFKEDFVFKRFLSSTNGTLDSMMNLLFINPIRGLSYSKFSRTRLGFTPLELYKKAGYKVIFVTSGKGVLYNFEEFAKANGVDLFIDANTLLQEYPKAKEKIHRYGVADEFIYKKVFELLKEAKEPLFIISLSVSNHPPFTHKIDEELLDFNKIPQNLLDKFSNEAHNSLRYYTYANDEFGKFLDKVKASAFKDKVIIAATGDHRVRNFDINFSNEKAFAYSVPFYLYIPKIFQKGLYYDKNRIGSHKDIFPTLYDLSLSKVEFLSLGGRSMLKPPTNPKLEFGFNIGVFIDEKGVYPKDSFKGYFYENNSTLKDTNKAFELDNYHKNFFKLYEELSLWQLEWRLKLLD